MRRRGFTLIELLVVMTIIAALLTLAVPRYFQHLDRTRETVLRSDLATMRDAVDKFFSDTGRYPESLQELVTRKYIRKLPADPITESVETWVVVATGRSEARGGVRRAQRRHGNDTRRETVRRVMSARHAHGPQRGFTFIGVLILAAVIGVGLAGLGQVWSVHVQREREQELLFVGDQYRAAILSYSAATPAGKPRFPRDLEDLLDDKRHPVTRRHLRQLYPDPLSGRNDWEMVRSPEGLILAVHSRNGGVPMKVGNFPKPVHGVRKRDDVSRLGLRRAAAGLIFSKTLSPARTAARRSVGPVPTSLAPPWDGFPCRPSAELRRIATPKTRNSLFSITLHLIASPDWAFRQRLCPISSVQQRCRGFPSLDEAGACCTDECG